MKHKPTHQRSHKKDDHFTTSCGLTRHWFTNLNTTTLGKITCKNCLKVKSKEQTK